MLVSPEGDFVQEPRLPLKVSVLSPWSLRDRKAAFAVLSKQQSPGRAQISCIPDSPLFQKASGKLVSGLCCVLSVYRCVCCVAWHHGISASVVERPARSQTLPPSKPH